MFTLTDKKESPEMRKTFVAVLEEMMDADPKVVALEADLGNASGFSKLQKTHPGQFYNIGIAEANMIGVAAGLSLKGYIPFMHTFSPFFARRALDQIFLEGAYAGNTFNIYASDPGVCAETNGGTHTTFEDMAIMRAIPGIEVYDPADAIQLRWLLHELKDRKGVHYIRAARKGMPQIYEEGSTFTIGRVNVLREGKDAVVIACGLGVHLALQAAGRLHEQGLEAAVVDAFCVDPLDRETILQLIRDARRVVTVENHSVINGLGSAVADIIAENALGVQLKKIGVRNRFGQVGSRAYLMEDYGLTVDAVVQAAAEDT